MCLLPNISETYPPRSRLTPHPVPQIGEGYCLHGDFINGWFDDAAQNMLKATSGRQWMRVDGAKGQGKAGASCQAKDADPSGGTSDYIKSVEMMKMDH